MTPTPRPESSSPRLRATPCITCRRSARPGSAVCGDCRDRLLAQAFGIPERDYHVERLSALDPAMTIKGRRVA